MHAHVDLRCVTVALLGPRGLTTALRGTYQRAAAEVVEFEHPEELSAQSLSGVGFVVITVPETADAAEVLSGSDVWRNALVAAGAVLPVSVERVQERTHGSITLVGGGPGDPGLITAAGLHAIAHADVIYADRLAPAVTDELAPGVRVVPVGKRPGHHPVPQSEIQARMIDSALAGETVVRLKGGDPFVFGRGGEELLACREAGVDVHVIPGITSAVAVPEHAGIPVTFRELSRSFTVVSGHDPLDERELEHLAGLSRSGATIVLLMGVATLPQTVSGLVRHGLSGDTPLAVLEKGFSPEQRSTYTTLATAVVDTAAAGCASPAVTVIGPVVHALADRTGSGSHSGESAPTAPTERTDGAAAASARERPALLACAHGTGNVDGQTAVAQLVGEVRTQLATVPVIDTWVDVQEPGLTERTRELSDEPAVIVPLLLSAGYHVYVDMARAIKGHPEHRVAAALGPDPRLATVMARRLREALQDQRAEPITERDTVIMAAAGSSEPDAVRDCRVTAEHLARELGVPVRVAFLSAAEPSVHAAVAQARESAGNSGSSSGSASDREGTRGRVLVATYLLAPGFFHDKTLRAGADITAAPLLLPDAPTPPELTELVIEHYELSAETPARA